MALALFDLDNTLLSGDSDHSWGSFLVSQNYVDAEDFAHNNEKFYADYVNGVLDIHEYSRFAFFPLTQNSISTLEAWREQYMRTVIRPMMTTRGQEVIDTHKTRGDTIVIITATNSFITRPIADAFGVDHLIATEPLFVDGRYEATIDGIPCYQEGKVTKLNEWMETTGQNLEGSWFYSDSHNDIPLLEQVSKPVAVDPDEQLLQKAQANGWEITSFR